MKLIKKNQKNRQGFTLVELLLVMAIIGILVSTISLAMSSSRRRSRVTASIKLGNSIMSEAADCYLNNKVISSPNVGTAICSGAGPWPELPKQCSYSSSSSLSETTPLTIVCKGDTVSCNLTKGNCVKSNPQY